MADYAIGLMNGRWNNIVHIAHMYAITDYDGSANKRQKQLLKHDLGFLIGKNPFALDRIAAHILIDALDKEGRVTAKSYLEGIETTAEYIRETYGILSDVPVEKISLS
jgi:hypothetical protein